MLLAYDDDEDTFLLFRRCRSFVVVVIMIHKFLFSKAKPPSFQHHHLVYLQQIPAAIATATAPCHARVECSNVPKANVFHRCGCATIKRTARRARTSFSHVRRPTARWDSSVAASTSSTRLTAFRRTTSATWSSIASMAVTNQSAVSLCNFMQAS